MKKAIFLVGFVVLFALVEIALAQSDLGDLGEPDTPENKSVLVGNPVGNTLYVVTFSSSAFSTDLYTIDPLDGSATEIGNVGIRRITDLEFYGNDLYAITFDTFIQIDPVTGQGTEIGSFDFGYGDMNSLAISPDGTPYAASLDGTLISINRRTGKGSYIGNFGGGLISSGDMAFDEDRNLYVTVRRSGDSTDWLAQVDLNTGVATLIGDTNYSQVWGLAFKDGQLYGATGAGALLSISPSTGAGALIVDHSRSWAGMTISPACAEVVDGICVATDLDHYYIAKIDLTNPDINLELASDSANPATGLFYQKKVEEFVQQDSGAGNNDSIARYYVAINGTAKSDELGDTTFSDGSILGIGGTTYGNQCVGGSECIDQPRASFFPFRYQNPLKIHRTGVDFPGDGGDSAKEYIQNQINTALFTVGYRSTILDTITPNGTLAPNFPAYVASQDDHELVSEKTALGISANGSDLFLATVDATISTQTLASLLMQWGAARAILLDSSWSTQFDSYAEDEIDRSYTARRGHFWARNDVNAIVAYNSAVSTSRQVTVANPGDYALSSNINLGVDANTFANTVNLLYTPQFSQLADGELRHVDRFFELTVVSADGASLDGQPDVLDGSYELVIRYQEATMPIDIEEETLRLYYWDGVDWVLEPSSNVDVARNIVVANPSRFGRWAVIGEAMSPVYLPLISR